MIGTQERSDRTSIRTETAFDEGSGTFGTATMGLAEDDGDNSQFGTEPRVSTVSCIGSDLDIQWISGNLVSAIEASLYY